jgi:hypothetical protein
MEESDWFADSDPLGVLITRDRETVRVELVGEADVWGWRRLRAMADSVLANPVPPIEVVLDMRKLRFACIRSLRLIADICGWFESAGIRASVIDVSPTVARAARLGDVRLPSRSPLVPRVEGTRDEALDLETLRRIDQVLKEADIGS